MVNSHLFIIIESGGGNGGGSGSMGTQLLAGLAAWQAYNWGGAAPKILEKLVKKEKLKEAQAAWKGMFLFVSDTHLKSKGAWRMLCRYFSISVNITQV